ncbi:guanylate kinase [Caproiciproducens sp.]|uniref:guanylate kinase n=1 Tax=Caproiciproducens sp. TaxID=1954376 RepID=UPI002898226E|nr:guanylate kinase [Caproiciproducens sp.]
MKSKGLLIVFSGPSGAGKDTILRKLMEKNPNIRLSVSATTRQPRQGEVHGGDYFFVDKNEFARMVQQNEMIETAEYCGNFYGTPRKPIDGWLANGDDVILEIEVQGGSQIKNKCPDSVSIFILPPSFAVLEQRLKDRKTESEEAVHKRLETARKEILEAVHYDYAVINDTVDHAVDEIIHIICAEKHKVKRDNLLIERILNHA